MTVAARNGPIDSPPRGTVAGTIGHQRFPQVPSGTRSNDKSPREGRSLTPAAFNKDVAVVAVLPTRSDPHRMFPRR